MKIPRWLKVVGWIFLAFLVYSVFQSPEGAADMVVGGVEGIGSGFGAVFTFFDAVLGRLGNDGVTALGTVPLAVAS